MLTDTVVTEEGQDFARSNAETMRAELHAAIDQLTPDQLLVAWAAVLDLADRNAPPAHE